MAGEASPDDMIEVTVRLPRVTVEQSMRRKGSGVDLARAILGGQRRRSGLLKGARFVDPLWDMSLELHVAAEEGRQFTVLSLCRLSGTSVTTALRYLKQLEKNGYTSRRIDEKDTRSYIVVMQPSLRAAVEEWLKRPEENL